MKTRFLISRMLFLHGLSVMGICFFAGISACKKDSPQPPVVISAISPSSGPYSTIVTITGSGFSANAVGDSVKFNGVGAVVQQASATQLTVVVPKAAGPGAVTVQVGDKSGIGPVFNFTYTYTVSTLAGSTFGFADGNGTAAQFWRPNGITSDAQGNICVADFINHRIRKIKPVGVVSTVAGSGTPGFADGNGNTAQFNYPTGVATDAQGNIYVADNLNHNIRKISPAGVVSTLAGSGTAGFADGNGNAAKFSFPKGVAVDVQSNIYVADYVNHCIRKISPAGIVSTLAGSGTRGFADGNGISAQFNFPFGVATDVKGNIYVADEGNNRIRKITPAGIVSTLAGSISGFADGNGTAAQFYDPTGVAADVQGNIYVADQSNHRIRKISPDGVVSTLAGNGTDGFTDGDAAIAQFSSPIGVTLDTKGNIYVADTENNRIRMITVQ